MPPYGDGTAPVDDESVLVMLSPPYGDKLQYQMLCLKTINKGFSPPYGDGTTKEQIIYTPEMFSPPYGENPLSHGLRRASSPEGGAYRRVTAAVKALPSGELARSA